MHKRHIKIHTVITGIHKKEGIFILLSEAFIKKKVSL